MVDMQVFIVLRHVHYEGDEVIAAHATSIGAEQAVQTLRDADDFGTFYVKRLNVQP